jgi:hypothetical protein
MVTDNRIDLQALPKEAWRPSEGASGRISNRVGERELSRIPVAVALPDPEKGSRGAFLPAQLWDFSLHGFAVLVDKTKVPAGLDEGARIGLRIDLGYGPLHAECVLKNILPFKGKIRIGLARRDLARRRGSEEHIGIPQGECIRLPAKLEVQAHADNPIFYGELSPLRLFGLRPGPTLEFLTRDPALPLFNGQRLTLGLNLPSSGDNRCEGVIDCLELAPGGFIKLRFKPMRLAASLANDLSELLVFEGGIQAETLCRYGLPTRVFKNRVRFSYVETMPEYEQVLALRRNAYVEVGKRAPDTRPEGMSFAWDKRSRILCAHHEGTLVASAAITFPENDSPPLRSEAPFPGGKFPGEVPPRSEILEVGALCTHKDYRRGDLLRAMLEQICRIFVLSDRRQILTLCDSHLLPLYLGIGAQELGQTVELMGCTHHLIRLSKETVTSSKGLGWLRWNRLYGDIMRDMLARGVHAPALPESFFLRFRLAFGPLADLLQKRTGERAFKRTIATSGKPNP